MLRKIISGEQTGADRAALDAAIEMGIAHGGWVPKGRLAEDDPIFDKYQLQEMPADCYSKSFYFSTCFEFENAVSKWLPSMIWK